MFFFLKIKFLRTEGVESLKRDRNKKTRCQIKRGKKKNQEHLAPNPKFKITTVLKVKKTNKASSSFSVIYAALSIPFKNTFKTLEHCVIHFRELQKSSCEKMKKNNFFQTMNYLRHLTPILNHHQRLCFFREAKKKTNHFCFFLFLFYRRRMRERERDGGNVEGRCRWYFHSVADSVMIFCFDFFLFCF